MDAVKVEGYEGIKPLKAEDRLGAGREPGDREKKRLGL